MNLLLSLWWKEYREQRPIWLAVAILGAVLVPGLALLLAPPEMTSGQEEWVRATLISIVVILASTYAAVCGAMLLANDRENGTEPFVDALPVNRAGLWSAKVSIGLLLVAGQTALMFLLSLFIEAPQNPNFRTALVAILLVLPLQCFAWSMCAAAVTRTVLGAVGLAVPFIVASFSVGLLLSVPLPISLWVWLILVLPAGGLLLSRYLYAIPDRRRLWLENLTGAAAPSSSRALLWLCWKQGKVQLLILGFAVVMLGNFLPNHGLWLWPAATLAIGIACGLEVFAPDQTGEGYRFLGNQRFSPLQLWLFKSAFWLIAAILAALVLVLVGHISFDLQRGSNAPRHGFAPNIVPLAEPVYHVQSENAGGLYLILSLPYGFAAGLLSAQLLRKKILGLMVSCGISVMVLLPWLPSLVGGGLLLWQVLLIPAVAIVVSAALMRPWLSGRMISPRPRLLLALCAAATGSWLAVSIWYRVAEIPELDEPFDVPAFVADFPAALEAGKPLREALADLGAAEETASAKIRQGKSEDIPNEGSPKNSAAGKTTNLQEVVKFAGKLETLSGDSVEHDPELAAFLDGVFAGTWETKLTDAVHRPLGMLVDPRQYGLPYNRRAQPDHVSLAERAGLYLNWGALRHLEKKQSAPAFNKVLTSLALAQWVRSKAPFYGTQIGNKLEKSAFKILEKWFTVAPHSPEQLSRLLKDLIRQDQLFPQVTETVKAHYLQWQGQHFGYAANSPVELFLYQLQLVPWEQERYRRMVNVLVASQLHLAAKPPWELPPLPPEKSLVGMAFLVCYSGLEIPDGPANAVSAGHWARIFEARWEVWTLGTYPLRLCHERAQHLFEIRFLQLQTALALYQAEHKHAAKELADLVPDYLPAVPINPRTGTAFTREHLEKKLSALWAKARNRSCRIPCMVNRLNR